MTDPLRYGVLGCGDATARLFVPGLKAASTATLAVVASRDVRRAEEYATRFACAAAESYAALLERDDVDVVYVGLPVSLHAEWAARALRAGKHVYCEKTLTASLSETIELLDLAARQGLRLAEGLMYRFHPLFRTVKTMVAEGVIGEPRSFVGSFGFTLPLSDASRRDPTTAMGILNETGCYPISAARLLFGTAPASAQMTREYRGGVDWAGTALLQFSESRSAYCEFGYDRSYRSTYVLWGTHGHLTVSRAFTTPADFEAVIHYKTDTDKELRIPAHNHFAAIIDAFSGAIVEERAHDLFEGDAYQQALTLEALRLAERRDAVMQLQDVESRLPRARA